jgi:long-subunit acyl-CoA synthetase (AMP-forming)
LNDVAAELESLQRTDPDEYAAVTKGIKQLKVLASGGSTVTPKQRSMWRALLGKPLFVGYGMSESFGVVAFTDYGKRGEYPMVSLFSEIPFYECDVIWLLTSGQDSVGMCMPNINMKIDDNGEICIKSPVLLKK